jgi:ubiquitin-conjugating enzyme E2 J2
MYTPSGRFQPSTRLCLSISDFHPKSFNPAWSVSTILIGLLSFMTSEEITTGSVSGTAAERKYYAAQSRWWNSTGGGSHAPTRVAQRGNIKAGDGGAKFKSEWPEIDAENWKWIRENNIDVATGQKLARAADSDGASSACGPQLGLAGQAAESAAQGMVDAVVQRRPRAENAGPKPGNWLLVAAAAIFLYVMMARLAGLS